MKSNKSLFNATLFKSNIKRFLPFSILFAIIEFIIWPLSLLLSQTISYDFVDKLDIEDLTSYCLVSDGFALIFAGAFALLVFSYLFSTNKCNALHAFPIGRKALFSTNILSAYVLLVVPQLFGFAVAIPEIALFSKGSEVVLTVVLLQLASIFLMSFIMLAIGALAMMLAGNAFSGAAIYFILHFLYSGLIEIASFFASVFGIGLNENVLIGESVGLLSPVVNLFAKIIDYDVDNVIAFQSFYIYLAIYFVAAIVLCALSYLIYKRRELECAGEMVAFEIENPFIRVIVSVIGASLISLIIGEIFSLGRIGYVVFYVVFSFIIYFATEMILQKKFNIFSVKLILRWVLCCALSIGVAIGVAVCQTNYIPNINKIKNAEASVTYDIISYDEETIKNTIELQKELIKYSTKDEEFLSFKHTPKTIKDYDYEVSSYVGTDDYALISISYALKNGNTVTREYEYYYDSKKINSLISKIETKNEYLNCFDYLDILNIDYSVSDITVDDYTNEEALNEIEINHQDFDKVIALLKEDIGTMTDNYSSLKKNSNNMNENVNFYIRCTVPKDSVKKESMEMLSMDYQYNDFIEGFINCYDYDIDTRNSYSFEINIYRLPDNSKTVEFLKNYQQ
ncbi:MAG: hypothetical protein E7570_05420 [Ruminococcaceae bacterium]|nr:hypothetical protein [Oscillospiraceae bacterium]